MLLVLLRHGIAEPAGNGVPDSERRLTAQGHRQMKQVARALAHRLPDAEAIYSSPLDRAHETAEWIARSYSRRMEIVPARALAPAADLDDFHRLLRSANGPCAYFVGHEPQLTITMMALTKMHADSELELEKGGCYGIAFDRHADEARLVWMLTPEVLR